MRPRFLALAVALPALLLTAAWTTRRASLAASEEAAVRAALDHYIQGHATGQGAHFAAAMHPVGTMYWVREGALSSRTFPEYIAGAKGAPAADEARRKRRIVSVDITGDAAMGKVELDYPQATLTDYMSLLKVNGEWKIVGKIFHTEPRK
ncbi:MAG TPA: nuclear transport factor 2 family protein [Gemmatimonadaceae bacterium]|nr:nuclear transport factor 2 family protein [Gemmatimonadaceae bacterium]